MLLRPSVPSECRLHQSPLPQRMVCGRDELSYLRTEVGGEQWPLGSSWMPCEQFGEGGGKGENRGSPHRAAEASHLSSFSRGPAASEDRKGFSRSQIPLDVSAGLKHPNNTFGGAGGREGAGKTPWLCKRRGWEAKSVS